MADISYSEKTTPQENVEEEIRNVTATAVVVSGEHSEICVDNCFPHLVPSSYFMSSSGSYQNNQQAERLKSRERSPDVDRLNGR